MPDSRLARTRANLPEGYQFGDAPRDIRDVTDATWSKPSCWHIWYHDPYEAFFECGRCGAIETVASRMAAVCR